MAPRRTRSWVKDHSLAALWRQYAESRAELGDWLLLYQVHSATLDSGILEDTSVLAALDRMRRQGLVIGLTVSGPRQADVIRRSVGVRMDGERLFGSVQATFTYSSDRPGRRSEKLAGRVWASS